MRNGFRVATYNVKVNGDDDSLDTWDLWVDAVAGAVRHHQPDVIGL